MGITNNKSQFLCQRMTTWKKKDSSWRGQTSSGRGGRGLGSGKHSKMQTAPEIPQKLLDMTGMWKIRALNMKACGEERWLVR